jgi:hypothetical protein
MHQMRKITTLAATLLLAACATRPAPLPGETADMVQAKLGKPTSIYVDGNGAARSLEYATGPMGQYTWMARLGPDGRLTAYEQVLTGEKFATLKVDQATKEQVLRTIGRPAERSRVAMQKYEVWSYRYKEAGVWNSLMHVHFDEGGVVRQMMNGPDPMYEPRDRSSW